MADNEVLTETVGTVEIQIAWGPILQAGAEALASALGTKLGEALGQAFTDAILGRSSAADDAFRREVIERLTRIEGKLNEVIEYLRQFPMLLREELVENDRNQLEASKTGVAAAIADLPAKGKPDPEDLTAVKTAAFAAAHAGEVLLRRGPACYLAGAHAMASVLSGYARIAKHKSSNLRSLGVFAQTYAAYIRPWIDEANPDSFISLLHRHKSEYDDASTVFKTLPTELVVFVGTPVQISEKQIGSWGLGATIDVSKDESQSALPYLWEIEKRRFVEPSLPLDSPQSTIDNAFKISTPSWWKTPIGPAQQINRRFELFEQAFSRAKLACERYRNHPTKIQQLGEAVTATAALLACCDELSNLAPAN